MNEELTPREHDELRSAVLEGAHRIKPVGAHRMQLMAASVAFVLVAGVAGGAFTAASLFRSAEVPPVSSPTPTVSEGPTPTPTPTPDPAYVQAFGGQCANVVDPAWLNARFDKEMSELPLSWQDPSTMLAGGMSCLWRPEGAYMSPVLEIGALPLPEGESVAHPPVCQAEQPVTCEMTVEAAGALIVLLAVDDGIDEAWIADIASTIAARAGNYPAPRSAQPQGDWWSFPECSAFDAALPEDWVDRVQPPTPYDAPAGPLDVVRSPIGEIVGVFGKVCSWRVQALDPDSGYPLMTAEVIPGGGGEFDQIAATPGAEWQSIEGVDSAVIVEDNYRWEKYMPALAMRVGANLLILRGDNGLMPSELLPLATPFIDAIAASQ